MGFGWLGETECVDGVSDKCMLGLMDCWMGGWRGGWMGDMTVREMNGSLDALMHRWNTLYE